MNLTQIFEKSAEIGRNFFDFLTGFYINYRIVLEGLGLAASAVFLWLVVFYMIKLKIFDFKVQRYQEILSQKELSRSHSIRAWQRIKKRLATGRQDEMKLAIIEADKILNELLKVGAFPGKDMEEKLKQISPAQLLNIESAREAHRFCRRVLSEPELIITRQEALENLKVYAETFKEFELIE